MTEKESRETKQPIRPLIMMLIAIVILAVLMCSLSLAIFSYDKKGSVVNSIQTGGSITIAYTEGDKGIYITDAVPMSDSVGRTLSGDGETFSFTVDAKLNGAKARYEIVAVKDGNSTLSDNDVRLYLEKSVDGSGYVPAMEPSPFKPISEQTSLGSPMGSMILESGEFSKTQKNDYILRMWLRDGYEVDPENPQSYTVTVNVYAKG